jgi:signal transduction histidine kinase
MRHCIAKGCLSGAWSAHHVRRRMRILQTPRVRVAAFVVVAVAAIAIPCALGVEAWNAARRHRQAAERALRDHADFAALTYRQRVVGQLFSSVTSVFRPLGNPRLAHPNGPLPPPFVLRQAASLQRRCTDCGPSLEPTYYFRLTLADSSIQVDGPPLSPERRAFLVADLSVLSNPDEPKNWDATSTLDTLGAVPELVYVTVRRGADGTPRAVYGFAVPVADVRDIALRPILTLGTLLPVPVRTAPPNDSVLSVALTLPKSSRELLLSSQRQPDTYSSSIAGGLFLGGWHIRVSLDPETAPPLLIGGLPPSRGRLLVALVALTIALMGATLFVALRALTLARLREDFVASVSHELRTPLAQILLFGETLSHGRVDSRREVRSAARIIVGEARRLMQLVDNVLAFRRREWSARTVADTGLEEQTLAPLVREIVSTFAPMAAAVDSRVRLVRADDVMVPIDRDAMRQVLLNLLDNANKYGPPGQTIRVGVSAENGLARLTVEDEGPGVPPAHRERVWQPFVRLQRDVDAHIAGSGIGLAVVRDLVARLGGVARIEEAPNGGARAVVELPGARLPGDTHRRGPFPSRRETSVECAS